MIQCCLAQCYVLSHFSCVWLFATPWTVIHQIPLSMEYSRQKNWSGLPFPSPGDFPNPGIESSSLTSPALAGGFFTTSASWEAHCQRLHWTELCSDCFLWSLLRCPFNMVFNRYNHADQTSSLFMRLFLKVRSGPKDPSPTAYNKPPLPHLAKLWACQPEPPGIMGRLQNPQFWNTDGTSTNPGTNKIELVDEHRLQGQRDSGPRPALLR